MAEENNTGGKVLAVILKAILGLILIMLGILMVIGWWAQLLMVVKGCLGLFLILCGLITLAIAKE